MYPTIYRQDLYILFGADHWISAHHQQHDFDYNRCCEALSQEVEAGLIVVNSAKV